MNLSDNTILITGGATGIGFALAKQLSERGNRVIVCGRREGTLAKAQAAVPALVTHVCDITDASSRQDLVEWLNTEYPALNVVINNAGVQYRRPFGENGALDNLDQEVAINFTAPVHLIGNLLPSLHRQPRPVIVNVTSGLAFAPLAGVPVYCATKAALHSFTLSLRHQLKPTGIRVVEVAPPIVATELGGNHTGGASPWGMSPDAFATEVLSQLAEGKGEVVVGMAVEARKQGEAMFERMNGH